MPRLSIQTTQARLGISTRNAVQTIRQPEAEMSIEQPEAKMRIEQSPGQLTIDQTKAWHNIDLKSIFVRTDEMASESVQLALEGIGRVASEGDELMRIENKGNPIAAQAERNSHYEFDLQPGGRPAYDLVDLHYTPHPTQISIEKQDPVIHAQQRDPEFSYQPGEVNMNIEQYPDVNIDWKV